ncbi:TonB-dependent receptor [Flexithrix dorotheae]|uniref:TonB-dependent receptor n=1 Tax=Flexithrix dorotheae TaxID=70993 RepID=UPI00037302AA|nr:TonB-dependent receptor [Flexithrix dorotheae]
MRIFFLSSYLLFGLLSNAFAQEFLFSGEVEDASTGEKIIGVTILINNGKGGITDETGKFSISLPPSNYDVKVAHIAYEIQEFSIEINQENPAKMVVKLTPKATFLNLVNITGSKYEKDIIDEVISVDILRTQLIKEVNAPRFFSAIDKVPGVKITDGQASIRGGSGFAYGAGSRVQMVVDGMPLITADRNDIRWNFIPIELIDQVEVLKGASSSLYGSAALNGVMHVRTVFPTEVPEIEIRTFYTHYGKPKRKELAWWNTAPNEYGASVRHMQQFGRFDLVASGSFLQSNSYLMGADQDQQRFALKTRWRPEKDFGLTLGLNTSFMHSDEADFIFWENANEGAYIPFSGNESGGEANGLILFERNQLTIDPYLLYKTRNGNEHELKARFYDLRTLNFVDNTIAQQFNADYNYKTKLSDRIKLITGINAQKVLIDDPDGAGNRSGTLGALYAQAEYVVRRFNTNLGFRYEYFDVSGTERRTIPVFRWGMNYKTSETSSIRASFGQGYRFPSLAEIFLDKSDEVVPIFPNPELKPEYGWNAELGFKKEVGTQTWKTYLDAALFLMDYYDMIEFRPGLFLPNDSNPDGNLLDYVGVKAENMPRTRVGGIEFSAVSNGKINQTPLRILAGYTYNYPVDLQENEELKNLGKYTVEMAKSMFSSNESTLQPVLNYRHRHLVKFDLSTEIKNFTMGLDFRYNSPMEKYDELLESFIPGFREYLERNPNGEHFFNLRFGYDFKQYGKFNVIVNNLTNNEYALRYAKLEPPRNFTFQYQLTFR